MTPRRRDIRDEILFTNLGAGCETAKKTELRCAHRGVTPGTGCGAVACSVALKNGYIGKFFGPFTVASRCGLLTRPRALSLDGSSFSRAPPPRHPRARRVHARHNADVSEQCRKCAACLAHRSARHRIGGRLACWHCDATVCGAPCCLSCGTCWCRQDGGVDASDGGAGKVEL